MGLGPTLASYGQLKVELQPFHVVREGKFFGTMGKQYDFVIGKER